MDFEFTDQECCVNCQEALNSLEKWYYMDDFGNQQGPFDSFMILYYIHFGYFEDDSLFFMYDKANGVPSNYNTLSNFVPSIVEDVTSHAAALFSCTHLMEHFPCNEEYGGPTKSQVLQTSPDSLGDKDVLQALQDPPQSHRSSSEFVTRNQSPSEQNEDLERLATKAILKKRVETNLKEADAHLMRVNSRRVSHMLEKSLSHEY